MRNRDPIDVAADDVDFSVDGGDRHLAARGRQRRLAAPASRPLCAMPLCIGAITAMAPATTDRGADGGRMDELHDVSLLLRFFASGVDI